MIARKSFFIVTSQFFIRFLGWIGLIVLAKLWGKFAPEILGTIGFAMAFLALFNVVAELGFSQAHIKRISEGKDLGTCIGTYAAIKLFLTSLMVFVVIMSILVWKYIFNGGFYDATTESVVIILIVYYIFTNLRAISAITFTGRKEIVKLEISNGLESVVKLPLIILVALAGVNIKGVANISPAVSWPQFLKPLQQFFADHAVNSLASTYVIAVMASFLVGTWFLRKYPLKRPSWDLFKSYFYFAMPIMLLSVIGVVSLNIDKIMIGYFWTSTEVGYYFTIQQILIMITILFTSVSTVLFPTLSKYHFTNNIEKLKQTTHLAERYISMVLIPPIVVIIVFVNPVINIMLSDAFLPAAPVLAILSVNVLFSGLSAPYGSLLKGTSSLIHAVKIAVIICITNILLNYLFIPEQGLLSAIGINGPSGAATATVISTLAGFFGLRILAKQVTGIKLLQSHTPRHIIAGLTMGVILYIIAFHTSLFPAIHWYYLLMFAGLGLILYIGVLYVLKEFNKQDLKFFIDMLHPKKMLKYVSSELNEKPKKHN